MEMFDVSFAVVLSEKIKARGSVRLTTTSSYTFSLAGEFFFFFFSSRICLISARVWCLWMVDLL